MKGGAAARAAALAALERTIQDNTDVELALADEVDRVGITGPDRRLAYELTKGVLRHRGRLNWYAAKLSRYDLPHGVALHLIHLGLYQFLFLDRVPDFAATNETVELARRRAGENTARYVNAVLRTFQRERDSLVPPDQKSDLVGFLDYEYSQPRWLVERWVGRWGPEEAEAFCLANLERPPLNLRANLLRASREEIVQRLCEEGLAAEPGLHFPEAIRVHNRVRAEEIHALGRGDVQIQDEASLLASHLLAPRPGDVILDLCSAPGGKATHLAQLTGDQARVIAVDVEPQRLDKVSGAVARLGLKSVEVRCDDATTAEFPLADRILADVPCSGLGTMRRHPDVKWHKQAHAIEKLIPRQRALLEAAARWLRPGGTIVYSTCTTEPEENEEMIRDFLERHSDFSLAEGPKVCAAFRRDDGMYASLPHKHGVDGAFAARLAHRTQEANR